MDTLGFTHYTEMMFVVVDLLQMLIWDLGAWPLYRSCPFFGGGRSEGLL